MNNEQSSNSEVFHSPLKSTTSQVSEDGTPTNVNEADAANLIMALLEEKETMNYDTFQELDSRLKLHLEFTVFAKDEQFEACLQTRIVPLSTGDEFKGLFVISSKKIYIVKYLMTDSEDIEKTIQVMYSCVLSQVKQIKIILGNQGMAIACGSSSQVYTLVIRDADTCNLFSSLLTDIFEEKKLARPKVELSSDTQKVLQELYDSTSTSSEQLESRPEVLLHLFAFGKTLGKNATLSATLKKEGDEPFPPICIVVTSESILISNILYKKKDNSSDLQTTNLFHYILADHQQICDLLTVEVNKSLTAVELTFLNESSNVETEDSTVWAIVFQTKSSLFSFISAVKSPWEKVFGIPLQLSTCDL